MKQLLTLLTALSIVGLVLVGVWTFRSGFFNAPRTSISATSIITQLQDLQRLETSVYRLEQIIEADAQGDNAAIWRQVLFGDRILLIAHGEVVAGIDLAKLSEDDISVFDNTVQIQLPAPSVFRASLDEEKTRVYDRSRGLLTRGDVDLESEARETAVQLLEQTACEGNILDQANQNAVSYLESLLTALKFEQIDITTTSASC